MSFGLTVQGDSGQAQIDAGFMNLRLVASGTASFGSTPTSALRTLSFTSVDTAPPYVLFRPSVGPYFFFPALLGGPGAWTGVGVYQQAWESGVTIDYQVFDRVGAPPSADDYGFQVFTESGATAFDSRLSGWLRATQVVDEAWPLSPPWTAYTYSVSSSDYFPLLGSAGFGTYGRVSPGSPLYIYGGTTVARTGSTTYTVSPAMVVTGPSTSSVSAYYYRGVIGRASP